MRGVLPQISQILTDVPPGGAAVSAAPTKQRCTAHRTHLGGYGIPAIPTPPAMIVFSHRWHRCTQMFRLRSIVPRNTQNTQKFSSARKFCEFCGSTFQQEVSVCSVNSVGRCNGCSVGAAETAAPPGGTSVSICEICGRTPRTLTFYVFRGRTRTVCLSTRPSST